MFAAPVAVFGVVVVTAPPAFVVTFRAAPLPTPDCGLKRVMAPRLIVAGWPAEVAVTLPPPIRVVAVNDSVDAAPALPSRARVPLPRVRAVPGLTLAPLSVVWSRVSVPLTTPRVATENWPAVLAVMLPAPDLSSVPVPETGLANVPSASWISSRVPGEVTVRVLLTAALAAGIRRVPLVTVIAAVTGPRTYCVPAPLTTSAPVPVIAPLYVRLVRLAGFRVSVLPAATVRVVVG